MLRGGDVELNGRALIAPVEDLQVDAGDLLTLVIDARDRNHSCDLTEIDLVIESADKRWSLSEDCAPALGTGNPHPDRHGNPVELGSEYFELRKSSTILASRSHE